MIKEERAIEKIKADIRSAGQTFLGMRMEDMLCRISELEDRDRKKKLIQEYFENQIGTFDSDIDGTKVRVNAVTRMIKADQVLYALELIDGSNAKVTAEAVKRAKETARKIKCGEISLPTLGSL